LLLGGAAAGMNFRLNNADVDVVENSRWGKARDDFATYRKVIRREMLWDWWPQEVSEKLQQFYADLKDGKRPKVAIMAPPQHGKSTAATDFITWVAGRDPNLKTIFAQAPGARKIIDHVARLDDLLIREEPP
jgi:hypothetical protein